VKEFFANAPEIIRAASSNPLGIVALAILTVATLAYLFFAKSTDERKTAVFFGTIAFVAFLVIGWALVTKPPTVGEGTVTSPTPTVAQPSTNQSPKVAPSSAPPSSPTIPAAYTRLHYLMAAGRWKEADEENNKVMLKVAGREKEGYLDDNAIKNFSCSALRDIDRLWAQASNGRFGYSVQKQIWKDIGGVSGVSNSGVLDEFSDRVGWRRGGNRLSYDKFTFNTNAPKGHLPSAEVFVWVRFWFWVWLWVFLGSGVFLVGLSLVNYLTSRGWDRLCSYSLGLFLGSGVGLVVLDDVKWYSLLLQRLVDCNL